MPTGYGLQRSRPQFVNGRSLIPDTSRAINQGLQAYQTVGSMMLSQKEQKMQEQQYADQQAQIAAAQEAEGQQAQQYQSALQGLLGPQKQFQSVAPARETQQALGGLGALQAAPDDTPLGQQSAAQITGGIVDRGLGQLGQQQDTVALQEQSDARATQQAEQLATVLSQKPEVGKMILDNLGMRDQAQIQDAYNFTESAKNMDYQHQTQAIQQRAEQVYNRGGDPRDTLELLPMSQVQRNAHLDTVGRAASASLQTELKPTKDIQNFEYAEQLKQQFGADDPRYQNFIQQLKVKSGDERAVSIEAKKLNNNLKSMQIDETDEKIFQKQSLNLRKADSDIVTSDEMIDLTDRVLNHEGLGRAVGTGSWTPTMPSGKAADFLAMKNELVNKAGFQNLITMKNLGATFGSLSENELKGLQQSAVNLEESQSPKQFKSNLARFKSKLEAAKNKQQTYYNKLQKRYAPEATQQAQQAQQPQEQDNNVIDWSSM